jgi:hypothetical protein
VLLHECDIETTDIDWPARGSVVHLVWSYTECFPVTEEWSVWLLFSNQVLSDYNYGDTSRANILLSTSIYNSVFFPVNWFGAEV